MLMIPFSGKSQISVDANGYVKMVNKLNITPYQTNGCQILPDNANTALLGNNSKYFQQIWGYHIKGFIVYSQWSAPIASDKKLKENFRGIDSPLSKLTLLKGWKYDYKPDPSDSTVLTTKNGENKLKIKKDRMGFIAQEVLDIFPESVIYDDEDQKYYLDYNSLIPVIVEAMKEQQVKIETLESEVLKLSGQKGNDKSATIDNNPNAKETPAASLATLSQNIPNPFSNNTTIGMSIPSEVSKAVLYIYNMQGVQISSYEIAQRGTTSITIEGYTLQAGIYLYTLIADGKEADTKKMILTK
jgi:hypothetical protein